jgi:hypothetical protein
MKTTKAPNTKAAATKPDAERTWKQFEDHLAPRLRLSVIDRAIYSHLFRHSRLEGKRQLRFSIFGLSGCIGLSASPVRDSVRRLIAYGVLKLVERTVVGHLVEVRLPHEIRAVGAAGLESPGASLEPGRFSLEQTDFFKTRQLRGAIHARESGLCFYCRKRLTPLVMCLDHVVPRVRYGRSSYRNLVSSCLECNAQKGQRRAADFLRWLYREQRLTATELKGRLRALDALAAGKLVPEVPKETKRSDE